MVETAKRKFPQEQPREKQHSSGPIQPELSGPIRPERTQQEESHKSVRAKEFAGARKQSRDALPSDDSEHRSWDHPLESLRREWGRAMESLPARWPFGRPNLENEPFWRRPFFGPSEPAVDVAEREDKYEVHVELPGVEEKDIQVRLTNGTLVIRAEKHGEREEQRKDYFLSERSFGTLQRSLRIPEGVDVDGIEANFDNGVLDVTLPKTMEARRPEKRIPIKSRSG